MQINQCHGCFRTVGSGPVANKKGSGLEFFFFILAVLPVGLACWSPLCSTLTNHLFIGDSSATEQRVQPPLGSLMVSV